MLYTATYSPDDNKLRLSASARLDAETYARVKAFGFKWAPKQEQFIAPTWTPGREDLLIELAGEIDDEDSTLMERAEQRAERFEGYQESRAAEAEAARRAVAQIADGIPLGQPILVGHHSERHARKDAERIENGMRRAVNAWETAEHWSCRARAAIRHAKYKERPDVRARRIKTIEADARKMERHRAKAQEFMRAYHDPAIARAVTRDGRSLLSALLGSWEGGLSPENQRQLEQGTLTVEDALPKAIAAKAAQAENASRWLTHYANRLAYERAMLADAGGTASDRTGPEKGGACRCWASPRGGWSIIQKVNRVTVTVLDNWGNGGRNFTRTIPMDNLSVVMSAAEVQAAREAGRVTDTANGIGFILLELPPVAPADLESSQPAPIVAAPAATPAAEFAALRDQLKAGVQVIAAPQLFPTPPALAARMIELAQPRDGDRVLEPSAGTGNLIRALRNTGRSMHIVAVEVQPDLVRLLSTSFAGSTDVPQHVELIGRDFLDLVPGALGAFDAIVMNPPFHNASDITHIEHAYRQLKPGGRLVAVCAGGPRQNDRLRPQVEACGGLWEPLPAGTFAESGTNVHSVLLTLHRDE